MCHILEFQNYNIINFFLKFLKNNNISDFVSLTFQILHWTVTKELIKKLL